MEERTYWQDLNHIALSEKVIIVRVLIGSYVECAQIRALRDNNQPILSVNINAKNTDEPTYPKYIAPMKIQGQNEVDSGA